MTWEFVVGLLSVAHAANWAQVGGSTQTRVTIVQQPPWSGRWGHGIAALDYSQKYMEDTGQKARLFVLGGDDQMQTSELDPKNLKPYPGGGGFRNDVWATTGIEWITVPNLLKKTKWGDPLPQIIAKITWIQRNRGKIPPRGVAYSYWIECASSKWITSRTVIGCDDKTQAPGGYLADNMFSPRRNFATMTFKNEIYVLGGRAREIERIPEEETRGGLIGPRMPRWRELSVLKNDVWKSSDAGASWELVSPGCLMPQKNLIHKSGDSRFQCLDDHDCDGMSYCDFEPEYNIGKCVCSMWSSREHFATVIHKNYIYLAGGYTYLQLNNCGAEQQSRPSGSEFACGGRYRGMMNDVWRSADGEHWEMVTQNASWVPRGEFAMTSLKGRLWILGGRTGETGQVGTSLLNDIWYSDDGKDWHLHTEHAPWSSRAKHSVITAPVEPRTIEEELEEKDLGFNMLLIAGEGQDNYLDDVWAWDGTDSGWKVDFGPGTAAYPYVDAESELNRIVNIRPKELAALEEEEIRTFSELVNAPRENLLRLRKEMPVCDYRAIAQDVISQCTVLPDEYDGMEYENVRVIRGQFGEKLAAEAREEEEKERQKEWDGCTHFGEQYLDKDTEQLVWPHVNGYDQVEEIKEPFDTSQSLICKWVPKPRAAFAASLFQGKVFLLSGKQGRLTFSNEVWYRDARRPRAEFTHVPLTFSSDTVFRFECDEPGCIFQYHVFDTVEKLVVRNWTKASSEINFLTWLDGGLHRLRVRAIDPAGNVDKFFEEGRNEHIWVYVPVLPWGLIGGGIAAFVVLAAAVIVEWRRRRKKAAMERYAMKRMRRKLKGVKKGGNKDVDWRKDYDDAKDGKKKKKKKKKDKDKDKGGKSKDKKKKKDKKKSSKDKDKKKKDKKKSGKDKDKKKDKVKKKDKDKDKAKKKKEKGKSDSKSKSKDKTSAKSKDKSKKEKSKDKKKKKKE